MPPVFGPVSPSPARLKSRAGASAITSVPSVTPSTDSSAPSSRSSTTTVAPLLPKRPSTSIASMAASDSSVLPHTITPLPRASPSAFTATRPSLSRAHALAGAGVVKVSKSAVGIPASRINDLAKALLVSMRPAPRLGPNTLKPASRSASPRPASTAASGPSTTSPKRSCLANLTNRTTSVAAMGTLRAMPPVPPLPGAQKTRSTSSDCTHFQTSACSRAPDPMTRTFMSGGYWITIAPVVRRRLLPLDGAGRFARDVEHDPVAAFDLVDDPVADPRQHLVWHPGPIRGHRIFAADDPYSDDVGVGAIVAHHAHGLERRQNCKGLPDLTVEAEMLDLVHHDPIGVAQDFQALGGDLSKAADRQARPGERLAVHHLLRHAELDADRAHLVLEQIAEGLDELESQAGRQPADVVVGLDLHGSRRHIGGGGLDHIGIKRPLREEVDVPEALGLGFENRDELPADDPSLFFGVDDSAQRVEESRCGVDVLDVHIEVAVHHGQHPLGLLFAQEAVVDEHARQLVADGAVDEGGGDGRVHTT